jgi:hypothetical protein
VRKSLIALIVVVLMRVCGLAQETSPQSADNTKPLIEYGFDERFRVEDMNNTGDFNSNLFDTQHRLRFRTRIWMKAAVTDDVEVYLRLADEWRKTTDPDMNLSRSFPDEGIVDNLYVDFKKLIVHGLSFRVGRQDISKGEGLILKDGTALDGSRSGYLNAFDLGYQWKKSKLEAIGCYQPKYDHYLPRINDRHKLLNESDQALIGGYYSDRNIKRTEIDLYYFLKKELNDSRSATAVFMPDRHFQVVGGRVNRGLERGFTAYGEFAFELGAQHANHVTGAPAADIRGWSGYGYLRKDYDGTRWKPYLMGGYFAFSGDDYKTPGTVEGWAPVFSRFAIRSDLLFNGFTKENGTGYWTNLRMPQFTAGIRPVKHVNAWVSYMYVDAFHPFTIGPASVFSRTGTHRGDLIYTRAEFDLSHSWTGMVQWETMSAGDFYVSHDRAYYFRADLTYTFKGELGHRTRRQ